MNGSQQNPDGKIGFTNGFRAVAALRKAASHPGIDEIEGAGVDEGRVFLHARQPWRFDRGGEIVGSRSVGSASDVREALRELVDTNHTVPKCQMVKDCVSPVTHIGSKGYIYCADHAADRRASGYERCRRMRAWECTLIQEGKPLPSYTPGPKPRGAE